MLIPVILAGGVGSRLWPLSRDLYPKQLLTLIGEQSLLQATVARVLNIPDVPHVIVVCNQQYQFLVEEQLDALRQLYPQVTFDLILEPIGKNTAPALALAALRTAEFPDALLLSLPADHLIEDPIAFAEQIQHILPLVDSTLVTFGIRPDYPETGYGYIEVDPGHEKDDVIPIIRFVEKPDLETAQTYCQQKNYYWNSGIFLYKGAVYLEELNLYAPEVLQICEQVWLQRRHQSNSIYLDADIYKTCPDISIDYAVMEKTHIAVMAPLTTVWSDVGSWLAVAQIEAPDAQGNVRVGDVIALDTQNCYLRAESRLVATVGLKDQIVVETADAVLVVDKSRAQDVKRLVEHLKIQRRKEAELHSILYQPWGHYEVLCESEGFIVKQLTVKTKGSLSAVTEAGTCEHWVVLSGVAHVFVDGLSSVLSTNQFVDILPETKYRIENEFSTSLRLLSIQTF